MQHTLYHDEFGYFAQQAAPVGLLPEPIAFNKLRNEADYRSKIRSLYDHLQVCKQWAWLSALSLSFASGLSVWHRGLDEVLMPCLGTGGMAHTGGDLSAALGQGTR